MLERTPTLKAVGLDEDYKILADFGDVVLAGRCCKTGTKFVTWEWDFDRQGVHAGHYFMENYEPQFRALDDAGALELLPDGSAILMDLSKYDEKTGLAMNVETGVGIFI